MLKKVEGIKRLIVETLVIILICNVLYLLVYYLSGVGFIASLTTFAVFLALTIITLFSTTTLSAILFAATLTIAITIVTNFFITTITSAIILAIAITFVTAAVLTSTFISRLPIGNVVKDNWKNFLVLLAEIILLFGTLTFFIRY